MSDSGILSRVWISESFNNEGREWGIKETCWMQRGAGKVWTGAATGTYIRALPGASMDKYGGVVETSSVGETEWGLLWISLFQGPGCSVFLTFLAACASLAAAAAECNHTSMQAPTPAEPAQHLHNAGCKTGTPESQHHSQRTQTSSPVASTAFQASWRPESRPVPESRPSASVSIRRHQHLYLVDMTKSSSFVNQH